MKSKQKNLSDKLNESTSEDELKTFEKICDRTFDNMVVMFQIIELVYDKNGNAIDYSYVQINSAFEKLVNKKKSELIGKRAKDIFGIIEDDKLKRYEKVDKTGKSESYKNYSATLDKYYNINVWKVFDGQVAIAITDISEVKLTEQKLIDALKRASQNEEKLVLITQATNDGLFDWNLETNEIYYSPSWKKMIGYQDNELPNNFLAWEKMTSPEDVKKWWELQHKLISNEIDRFVLEFKMKHKKGHWVDILLRAEAIFNDSGKAIRIVGTHIDITERKLAEFKLKESQNHLAAVFNNTTDLQVFLKYEGEKKFIVVAVNDTYINTVKKIGFNYTEKDLIGKSLKELLVDTFCFSCELCNCTIDNYQKAIDTQKQIIVTENFVINGKTYYSETSYTPIINSDDQESYILYSSHDITKNKQVEEDLLINKKRNQKAQAIGHVGNWEIDLVNKQFWGSEETRKIFGFPAVPEILSLQRVEKCIQDRARVHKGLVDFIEHGKKYDLIYDILTEDEGILKTVRSVAGLEKDAQGKPFKITGVLIDITLRKKADDELVRIKDKAEVATANITAIIEGTENSIWAFNSKYEILYLNHAFQEGFLKSFGVLIQPGMNLFEALPEKLQGIWKKRYERVLANEAFAMDDAVTTDQGVVYIHVSFNPIVRQGVVVGASCISSNITERKLAELELEKAKNIAEESEKQFKNLFNNAADAIFIVNEENGFIIDANRAAERLLLMAKRDIIGLHYSVLHPIESTEFIKETFLQYQQDNAGLTTSDLIEQRVVRSDGIEVPVEISASKEIFNGEKCLIGIFRDISERKIAEEAIFKSKKMLEIVMDSIPQYIFWKDRNSVYLGCNENFAKVAGVQSAAEIVGKTDSDLAWKRTDAAAFVADDQRVIETGKAEFHIIERQLQAGGKRAWLDTNKIPMHNSTGEIIGVLGTYEDITVRKKVELQLLAQKEQAEKSDLLKSAFLANMSHEIRTPMNGIIGFAELLKQAGLAVEQQAKFIDIIEKSGKRMLNIVNDIIDISKIEAGLMKIDMQESNVNEQMEYIYTFFKPEVESKGMTLVFNSELPANEALIKTDREKVFAILTNLIKNAIKYSNKGSIEFACRRKGAFLEFYVKDTGVGIPKDRIEAIFERFIQADVEGEKVRQGAGLGLAITKSYIEMLGGKIWAESEEGLGSTFYFTLPYQIETEEKKKIANEEIINKAGSSIPLEILGLKVLIVEDDEISDSLITIAVQQFSNNIIRAKTGIEAIEACRKNTDINLVLMDVKMPEMDGFKATEQIRQFNKGIIIIAQTAYGLAGDREKALEAGCDDYIAKPINAYLLLELIKQHFKNDNI